MAQKILLIEDSAAFRKTVAGILAERGYQVTQAATGREGVEKALREGPDLVVLDLVMPGMRGLEVCQQLKQDPRTAGTPILILTGNDKEGQDVACLDMGADDYLTKPVKTERLTAYCRSLLRRTRRSTSVAVRLGTLELDYARKSLRLDGKEYPHLTPKEFGLLYELARASPDPVDRAELYASVWGMEPPSDASLKTVEVHVRRIRLKLGWRSDRWLTAVHGRGYCLTPPTSSRAR